MQRHDRAKNLAALAIIDLDGRRHIAICPAETPGSAMSVHEDFVLVSMREVFWFRWCPTSYSEKGDIDVQIGRRREASPSMSDFGLDRKSANPLFNKIFFSGTAHAWDSANASARRRP
ncbi:hypothetical protein [Mesorhizobium sp. M0809]|uniref:hypothetical protein n=1 Tax=Mesorhizobium sp. M0809 TaxID=2957003 RepID=UPI0033366FF7